MTFAFEKLQVYQKAVSFADSACTLTRDFPRGYLFLAGNSAEKLLAELNGKHIISADTGVSVSFSATQTGGFPALFQNDLFTVKGGCQL